MEIFGVAIHSDVYMYHNCSAAAINHLALYSPEEGRKTCAWFQQIWVTYRSKLAAVPNPDARPSEVLCDVSEVHIDH